MQETPKEVNPPCNTVLVTAGIKREHEAWARRLVNHVNALASNAAGSVRAVDLSTKIPWGSLSYSPLAKLHVWRCLPDTVDRVVWVDTDTYVCRAILENELPRGAFCAVRDPWIQGGAKAATNKVFTGERLVFLKSPAYFNSGFFCATRESIPAFELAIAEEPHKFRRRPLWTREQDLFNWAVWKTFSDCSPNDAGWVEASERWNVVPSKLADKSIEPIVIHAVGSRNKAVTLNALFAGKKAPL